MSLHLAITNIERVEKHIDDIEEMLRGEGVFKNGMRQLVGGIRGALSEAKRELDLSN